VKTQGNLCVAYKMNVALIPLVVCSSVYLYKDNIAWNSTLSGVTYFVSWANLPMITLGRFSAKPGTGKLRETTGQLITWKFHTTASLVISALPCQCHGLHIVYPQSISKNEE